MVVGVVVLVEFDDDATELWHMCLSHLNDCGMTELHKRYLVKEAHNYKFDLCKYYILGKSVVHFLNLGNTKQMESYTVCILMCGGLIKSSMSVFQLFCAKHGIVKFLPSIRCGK